MERNTQATSEFTVSDVNLSAGDMLSKPMNVSVKIRYRSPYAPAMIEPSPPGEIRVRFENSVPGVCPGQAAVFYSGETVVGGGIIES